MAFLEQLPWHPMFVHFPVALFASALTFELLSRILKKELFHHTAVAVYVFAVCVTPLTVYTGLHEADELHLKHPVLDIHKQFGLITLWVSLVSLPVFWLLYKRSVRLFKLIFLLVLSVVVGSVSVTAYNGGRMVYEYGVGVPQ